jgi:hypothetical protein
MLYYLQLIYVKKGCEQAFHDFEEKVLPLLADHNGELIYRIRPDEKSFIASSRELPYEIHLVTFKSKADFENYGKDPARLAFVDLKNNSVEKIILVEGSAIG